MGEGNGRPEHDDADWPRCVLVGVDFSTASECAVGIAKAVATAAGAAIHLVHAHDVYSRRKTGVDPLDVVLGFDPFQRRRHERATQAAMDLAFHRGIDADNVHLPEGEPVSELVTLREQIGADLVVVGGTSLGSVRGYILGSHADRLLRRPGPALMIVNEAPRTGTILRIAVGLEQPDLVTRALRRAVTLARQLGARLRVIHALPPRGYASTRHAVELHPETAEARVRATVKSLDSGLAIETVVEHGDAPDVLIRAVAPDEVDVLVIGAERHGDGWPGRVADRLARAGLPAVAFVWSEA